MNKIFLITPLGEENSTVRRHADKMWNEVFCKAQKSLTERHLECEFQRLDLLQESSMSRVKRLMNLIKESKGCIIDLYNVNNLNVIYEIGLAHSQGKRVYFLRSKDITENQIPSDIRYDVDFYHLYNIDIFDGNASSDEIGKIIDKVTQVAENMISGNDKYRPSFYEPTEVYVSTLLESIYERLSSFEKTLNDSWVINDGERIPADYIRGEDKAFTALTEAILKSNVSVKTTRFSPYSVVNRQNKFFTTINDLMSSNVHPKTFERIITANNKEKFTEIRKLIANNTGKQFKIYISKIEYGFEMVVIDDEIVFIHFRQYQNETNKKGNDDSNQIITATLKIKTGSLAHEFATIFDSIAHNSKDIIFDIDCSQIDDSNFGEMVNKYKEQFYEAVEESQINSII